MRTTPLTNLKFQNSDCKVIRGFLQAHYEEIVKPANVIQIWIVPTVWYVWFFIFIPFDIWISNFQGMSLMLLLMVIKKCYSL